MADPKPLVIDRQGVDHCFGCGEANQQGLHLKFAQHDNGTVETRHHTAPHHCGLDTVVHGGIQAAILDELMGVTAQVNLPADASNLACVTAEMQLTYKAPVMIADEVIARAWLVRAEGRDLFIDGAIVDADGRELTTASSRWRQLRTDR